MVRGESPPAANRLSAPPLIVRPEGVVTATRSEVPPNSKVSRAPGSSVRLPTERVPAVVVVAGDSMPPLLTVTVFVRVPVPPRVAPEATVVAEEARAALTSRVPLLTEVVPV